MDKILCWQPSIGSFLLQLLSHSPWTFYFSDNCIFLSQLFKKQMTLNYNITVLNLFWNYSSSACRELFTDKTGVITSPYYPGYYANDSWCEWLVTAAFGHVIRLEFFLLSAGSDWTSMFKWLCWSIWRQFDIFCFAWQILWSYAPCNVGIFVE